jgi:hypothetical protein
VADWATISSLATAGGTLVLALATFASVRSGNRTARAAERSLLAGLRPLVVNSRLQDPPQKVMFADAHFVHLDGSAGTIEVTAEAIYLTASIRNVGSGIAVLHGWLLDPDPPGGGGPAPSLEAFRRLTRDLYVPSGDIGFWQGAFREPGTPDFVAAAEAAAARRRVTVDLLYGDFEGGQRTVTRLAFQPRQDSDAYLVSVSRHWSIDRNDPR